MTLTLVAKNSSNGKVSQAHLFYFTRSFTYSIRQETQEYGPYFTEHENEWGID